jgi:hypothetical protein
MQDDSEILCDLNVLKLLKNNESTKYGMLLIKQAELNAANLSLGSTASLLRRKSQLHIRIQKIANNNLLRPKKIRYIVSTCILILMISLLIPVNNIYADNKSYIEQKPTLYAFWINDNISFPNKNAINLMSYQMLGQQLDNKDIILLKKDYKDLAKFKYPLLLEETWPISSLSFPIEVETINIRKEVRKKGLNHGKIYIFLNWNVTYTKYSSLSIGKKTLVDLQSLYTLNQVKLY